MAPSPLLACVLAAAAARAAAAAAAAAPAVTVNATTVTSGDAVRVSWTDVLTPRARRRTHGARASSSTPPPSSSTLDVPRRPRVLATIADQRVFWEKDVPVVRAATPDAEGSYWLGQFSPSVQSLDDVIMVADPNESGQSESSAPSGGRSRNRARRDAASF